MANQCDNFLLNALKAFGRLGFAAILKDKRKMLEASGEGVTNLLIFAICKGRSSDEGGPPAACPRC